MAIARILLSIEVNSDKKEIIIEGSTHINYVLLEQKKILVSPTQNSKVTCPQVIEIIMPALFRPIATDSRFNGNG